MQSLIAANLAGQHAAAGLAVAVAVAAGAGAALGMLC